MRAVDTNVLARLILQDDVRQAELAADVLRDPVWVSTSVWVELGWVLSKRLKLERTVIGDALSVILAMDSVHVADRSGLEWAISRYRHGADWADVVHLVAARGVADRFVTFDRVLADLAAPCSVPIETLA